MQNIFWKKDKNYVIIVLHLYFMNRHLRQKAAANPRKNLDWKRRLWTSNIFSILLIILLIASFVKVGKEIMLRWEIKKEIQTLQAQLDDLESRKSKMDKLISYLKTDEYIEQQARVELGFSKPGEKQINLVDKEPTEGPYQVEDNRSNLEKWYYYFFD